jgi:hypothetical protein
MQTTNEAPAAWKVLVQKFLAFLLSALAAPAV